MNIFKSLFFFSLIAVSSVYNSFGQANPYIEVLPANSGVVVNGATLDLQIKIGNTGTSNIAGYKLRPYIEVPAIVTLLQNADQTGLPPGWTVVSNSGSKIQICNGTDAIAGSGARDFVIKVKAVAVGGPSTFIGQIAFGNGTSCANNGASVTGNNTADDNATSTITVVAGSGCKLKVRATAGTIACNGGTTTLTGTADSTTNAVEYSINGGAFQNSNTFTVLGAYYDLVAREVNNPLTCQASTKITIVDPAAVATPSVTIVQPSCTVATGSVAINSPTSGLTFSIDGGAYTSYPIGGYSVLAAGNHTIIAKNTNGCPSPTYSFFINTAPTSSSIIPSVSASATPITCFGAKSTIAAIASGGVAPYTFSINDGAFDTARSFSIGAGAYIIAVKDANGCIAKTTSNTITQPTVITASAAATAILCNGYTSTITISATGGGVGTYEYSLNSGAFQTSKTFIVPAGNYRAKVRMSNNTTCLVAANNTITLAQPAALKASASANSIAVCGGTTEVAISAWGGTPPYAGSGTFSKGPGIWKFPIMDQNGCKDSATILILPPGCMELKVFPNPAHHNLTVNHSAAVSSGATIHIVSLNGQNVMTKNVSAKSFTTEMNVSMLPSGTYLIEYINGDDTKESQFIKLGN